MKTARKILLLLVFAALMGAAPPVYRGAGTEADPFLLYQSDTARCVFEDVYTPGGIVLVRAEVQLTSVATGEVQTVTLDTPGGMVPENGEFAVPLYTHAQTLPNGTYQLRVRVVSQRGDTSPWTQVYWVLRDWRSIPAPGGCRIEP